jgi:hypothetical protein
MAELSLTQVLGAGATQDATKITILKADLVGLTANANNRADALAVGILNLLTDAYTPAARAADKEVSLIALPQVPQIQTETEFVNNVAVQTSYLNKPLIINLYSLFSANSPAPNDY